MQDIFSLEKLNQDLNCGLMVQRFTKELTNGGQLNTVEIYIKDLNLLIHQKSKEYLETTVLLLEECIIIIGQLI